MTPVSPVSCQNNAICEFAQDVPQISTSSHKVLDVPNRNINLYIENRQVYAHAKLWNQLGKAKSSTTAFLRLVCSWTTAYRRPLVFPFFCMFSWGGVGWG